MKPWQYGVELLTGFVIYALGGCVYMLFCKLRRGQSWKASFQKSFRSVGIAFLLAALGTLAHMGRHNVLALPSIRILCVVLAVIFWLNPIVWFIRIMRRVPEAAQEDSTANELMRHTQNKWMFVSLILAMMLTATVALS